MAEAVIYRDRRDFADAMVRARREQGLTRRDIAAALGVSESVVWAWEGHRTRINPERALQLAKLLDLQVEVPLLC